MHTNCLLVIQSDQYQIGCQCLYIEYTYTYIYVYRYTYVGQHDGQKVYMYVYM